VGNLAGPLPREEDRLERTAGNEAGVIEGGPECGISLSARTRSRLLVALRSMPRQGLTVTNSSFAAQAKTAETAASV
jgi:hypothetical protein